MILLLVARVVVEEVERVVEQAEILMELKFMGLMGQQLFLEIIFELSLLFILQHQLLIIIRLIQ